MGSGNATTFGALLCVVLGTACADATEVSPAAGSVSNGGSDTTPAIPSESGTSSGGGSDGGDATPNATTDGTSASTTDASTTTDPTAGSGDPTSGDAGGASTTTEGGSTSSSSFGGSSGGTDAIGYPACPSGNDGECPDGFNCMPLGSGDDISGTFCGSMDCVTGDDCPGPADGNAEPMCIQASTPVCILSCDAGQTCPTGMSCLSTQEAGDVCFW